MDKPVFTGDPNSPEDLAAYEAELRAWEAEIEREKEAEKQALIEELLRTLPFVSGGSSGPPGPQGAQGPAGTDGSQIFSGDGAPSSGLGVDGDYYVDKTFGTAPILYKKISGVWECLAKMGTHFYGSDLGGSPPNEAVGVQGDFFLDTSPADMVLWGPKFPTFAQPDSCDPGTWLGTNQSLLGPQGPKGDPGANAILAIAQFSNTDTSTNFNSATPVEVPITGTELLLSPDFSVDGNGIVCDFDGHVKLSASIALTTTSTSIVNLLGFMLLNGASVLNGSGAVGIGTANLTTAVIVLTPRVFPVTDGTKITLEILKTAGASTTGVFQVVNVSNILVERVIDPDL